MDKVVLIGDSIRMGYDRYVRCRLSGRAEVYYSSENSRMSSNLLRVAKDQIEKECELDEVTLIHFNVGLWDVLRIEGDGPHTPLPFYEDNLRRLVKRLRRVCPNAKLIFATSTPVLEDQFGSPDHFMRYNADIEAYNAAAVRIMEKLGVAVNDLYAVAKQLPREAHSDATHFYTELGKTAFGDAVTEAVLRAVDEEA